MSSVGCPTLNQVVVDNWRPGTLQRTYLVFPPAQAQPGTSSCSQKHPGRASSRRGRPSPRRAPSQPRSEQEAVRTTLGAQQHVSWLAQLPSAELSLQLFGTQITSCILFNPSWLLTSTKLAGICLFLRLLPSVKLAEIPQRSWKLAGKWQKDQWMHWRALRCQQYYFASLLLLCHHAFRLWALLKRTHKALRRVHSLVTFWDTDQEKVLQSTPKANGETATGSLCGWVKGIIS